jgi:hypothetical protein
MDLNKRNKKTEMNFSCPVIIGLWRRPSYAKATAGRPAYISFRRTGTHIFTHIIKISLRHKAL